MEKNLIHLGIEMNHLSFDLAEGEYLIANNLMELIRFSFLEKSLK